MQNIISTLNLNLKLKSILILILIVSLMIAPASAGLPDVDIGHVLPGVMSQGFDAILMSIGNQLYSSIGAANATNATEILSKSFITPNTFLENESLQKAKDFNAFWYGLFYLMFLVVGACVVMSEKAAPDSGFVAEESFGNKYIEIAIGGILLFMFYLYGLDALFKFETALSYGITLEAMDMIVDIPTSSFLYLLLAVMFFIVNCFFVLRYLILVILATYFLFLIAMYKIPVIGSIVYVILLYGVTFLFIRPIIALVLLAGSGAVAALPVGCGLDIIAYIMLLLLVIVIALLVMIAPFLYIYLKAMMPIKIMRMRR
jgi:hypothetical protein